MQQNIKRNYHKEMLKNIKDFINIEPKKRLLLHSCCAPCSSYVIEFLSQYFDITVFFYNPNIHPKAEFDKRFHEQLRYVKEAGYKYKVIEGKYDEKKYYEAVKGKEVLGEFSERCFACYEERMMVTAIYAKENDFDYFGTTLSISPLKNVEMINKIGSAIEKQIEVDFLLSDFKKNEGYKRSIELSHEYNIYRQEYCGCAFSKKEREEHHRKLLAQEMENK